VAVAPSITRNPSIGLMPLAERHTAGFGESSNFGDSSIPARKKAKPLRLSK